MSSEAKCPFTGKTSAPKNSDWWPNQLNLQALHQPSPLSDPMGEEFDYAKEFKSLDLHAVIKDLHAVMTDSQAWWPADFYCLDRPARMVLESHVGGRLYEDAGGAALLWATVVLFDPPATIGWRRAGE